jgi:hypothetical protein
MKFLLTILITLLFALSSSAQTKKTVAKPKPTPVVPTKPTVEEAKPTQKVTIEKLNGDRLTGLFVGGDTESIIIEVSGTKLPFKITEISNLQFGESPNKSSTIDKNKNAIDNALKSLRKLAAATEVGVSFREYGTRLIDVKTEIEELLPDISEGNVKEEIKLAMEAYADASKVWNEMIKTGNGDLFPDYEPWKTLQQKYSIPTYRYSNLHLMTVDKSLKAIWAAANQHIENAAKGQ